MATVTETKPPIAANALAIAIRWYNVLVGGGLKPDSQGFAQSLIAHVANDIASLEHKRVSDVQVQARARVAAWSVIAAKAGSAFPSGGVVNAVGGTISEAGNNPVVNTVKDVVTAPLTVAEFLGKLTDVHIWIRTGEVIGGAALILVGVRMLAREMNINVPVPRIPIPRKG